MSCASLLPGHNGPLLLVAGTGNPHDVIRVIRVDDARPAPRRVVNDMVLGVDITYTHIRESPIVQRRCCSILVQCAGVEIVSPIGQTLGTLLGSRSAESLAQCQLDGVDTESAPMPQIVGICSFNY